MFHPWAMDISRGPGPSRPLVEGSGRNRVLWYQREKSLDVRFCWGDRAVNWQKVDHCRSASRKRQAWFKRVKHHLGTLVVELKVIWGRSIQLTKSEATRENYRFPLMSVVSQCPLHCLGDPQRGSPMESRRCQGSCPSKSILVGSLQITDQIIC